MSILRPRYLPLFALVLGLSACGDSSGTGRVTFQLSSRASMPMSASIAGPRFSSGAADQAAISLGGDQIVIDQVELVLRKIRFEGIGAGACEGGGTGVSGEAEECGEFRAGPELFDLPLGEGVLQTFTATVPVGAYREVQFQIHRPTDENGDAAFLAGHPDFGGASIRVTGTYQRAGDPTVVPFTYVSDLTEVLNVALAQPIEVAEGQTLALTLSIDLSGWFTNVGGTGLVDPAQALDGQPLETMVEQNIRSSFHAFEDDDGDGTAD
ncbi:MAG TPA: hypothetical protein VFG66_14805 [Gemmatimonadales bacterium]|nr:hypothetical protein [Gemmatimonadales bacterium]